MSRPPKNTDQLQRALDMATSDGANELRIALSVLLPNLHGISLLETAILVGKSASWVSKHRAGFMSGASGRSVKSSGHGGRRNQVLGIEQEESFLEGVGMMFVKIHKTWCSHHLSRLERAALYPETRLSFCALVQRELSRQTGHPVSRATAYNLMSRVGRKRFPDYRAWRWKEHFSKLI